jgi:Mce-associated membrane protein
MTVANGSTTRRKGQETDMPAEPEKDKAETKPEASEAKSEKRRSPATKLLALLAAACVVMAVGCVYLWHQTTEDRAVERAREDARAAAQSEAKDLLSYNFRTLDYDLSKAKSEMTPGMAKSFSDYWKIFRPSVEKSQTQALTQIQVTGVTDATATHVQVVLFVKMISVNAAHKEPQVDTSWPRLEMQKVGKKWLIDGPRMTTPPPASSTPSTPAPSKPAKAPSGKPSKSSSGH